MNREDIIRMALKLALEYRPSMPIEVLHSWAADMKKAAQEALAEESSGTEQPAQRCPLCDYQHGHAIGCENNPVEIALNKMAENARELGLDYESIVEQVEDSVGMGHKAWDMVDPKELAKGFHEALVKQPAQPKLSDYEPDGMRHNKPQKRPQNCGTGYCSCIECLFEQPAQPSKPLPEDYTAMEQALTRLQKRYAELEGKASKPWVELTDAEFQWIYDNGRTPAGMMELTEAKLREKNA